MKFLFINGVNLDLLGSREPDIYGLDPLEKINAELKEFCEKNGDEAKFFQSDIEGEICREIGRAKADAIILNAGAYSHYSLAIRDAVSSIQIPAVEVHISNIFAREEFRSRSVIAPVCRGVITGFGKNVYKLAVLSFKL